MADKLYGGRWRQGKQLGEGGQARTYKVTDTKSGDRHYYVAKELRNERLDEQGLKRFADEVRAVSRLSHKNIVELVDFAIEGEEPFLIVEYCEGKTLEERRDLWRNDPGRTIEIFQQICEGVHHAYVNGMIHRDTQSSNCSRTEHIY